MVFSMWKLLPLVDLGRDELWSRDLRLAGWAWDRKVSLSRLSSLESLCL